ncbi:neprilysin-4-like isoform X2 [Epargyreus clarus]|uniref:neprilysin-4-like isoform X2 n=1 Tax=Epargyreus clarus TaxID=520877 RepID=UPI003C2CB343
MFQLRMPTDCQLEAAMTRVDTRSPPHAVQVKAKSANFCKFLSVISLAIFVTIAYYIYEKPLDPIGDPSDQFVVKHIPKTYTKLENVDPDERDVFQGFRTSFLPHEEIVLANKCTTSTSVYKGNVSSETSIWGSSNKEHDKPTRVKRTSHITSTYQDYDLENPNPPKHNDEGNEDDEYHNNDRQAEIEYESNSREHYEDNDKFEGVIHPELYVDRGPLDDVVEQVRRQPELEEGEMISSAHLYKPARAYAGIHAFWKGEGDKETIRNTQANIMKQYMDADADPCHDFYQYACGNWAALNPIPADKAGYDTFEMLRESLDTVLKDLLEFKSTEQIPSVYPGEHLDTKEFVFRNIRNLKCMKREENNNIYIISPESNSASNENSDDTILQSSEIINRIRRYLDKKSKKLLNPVSKVKYNINKYFLSNQKHQRKRIKRFSEEMEDMHKSKLISKRQNINNEVPLDLKLSRINFNRNKRKNNIPLPRILEGENKTHHEHRDTKDATMKARFLFKSCMNYEILEKRGHQPLLDLIDLLGGWPILDPNWNADHFDWLELMAKLRLYNNDILLSEWVGPDIKNSDEFVIQFDQTSLGLPTRDYYLQASNKVYLDAYKAYFIKVTTLLGGSPEHVRRCADELIEFEIKLAKITSAPEDRRNVSELYRRMPLRKLEELVPQVMWRKYLCIVMNRTVHSEESIVLFALNYVQHLVQLIDETHPNTLANYLLWRFVRHRVNNLDDRFQSARQQFYFVLFGREQSPPRWKNCISQVNSNMGMALGSMFVKKYFDEMSKNDTLKMTREIQQSFRELLHKTDWIDDETKKLAAHKVDTMMLRIGYPDFIINKEELDDRYKEVAIHPDKYFENILNILQHLTKMEQSRIGQPVNKTLWNTAPAVVNAYYSRNKNQIMFPAGILQPPFYHRHFPRSLNYGGIGVVIGHEITHGFDDKGRLFDCEGNLHRWWSDSAIEAFHRRAQCLIDQYSQYIVPEVNVKLDGANTQGENIADNGGVKQAFHAYLNWLEHHDASDETLPGLNQTNTQLFFLNFAQVWCGAMRPEAMRNKLKTAVHSPGRFRVIGTLSNSNEFAKEFHCPPGSPMNPVKKCTVW